MCAGLVGGLRGVRGGRLVAVGRSVSGITGERAEAYVGWIVTAVCDGRVCQ